MSEPEREVYSKNSLTNQISHNNRVKVSADSKCDIGWELYIEHNLPNWVQSVLKNSSINEDNSEFLGMNFLLKFPSESKYLKYSPQNK